MFIKVYMTNYLIGHNEQWDVHSKTLQLKTLQQLGSKHLNSVKDFGS